VDILSNVGMVVIVIGAWLGLQYLMRRAGLPT
jgi:hypothetical protein